MVPLLHERGHHVDSAARARDGDALARSGRYDVLLLSAGTVCWPEEQLADELPALRSLPTILLLSADQACGVACGGACVEGVGSNDYLVKPVSVDDLEARMRVLTRSVVQRRIVPRAYRDEHLSIDPSRRLVERDGQRIELGRQEFILLTYLLARRGRVVSRDELIQALWGQANANSYQYLSQYVGGLRRKIEADPRRPCYLRTHRGVGYWFQGAGDAVPMGETDGDAG
jgi:two-component system KDP operon response regulator KdpE